MSAPRGSARGPGAPRAAGEAGGGDPCALPDVTVSQVMGALARRGERRRELMSELRAALSALDEAVTRHARRVDAVWQAVDAHGGDVAALDAHAARVARLELELDAARRTLANATRASAEGAAGLP